MVGFPLLVFLFILLIVYGYYTAYKKQKEIINKRKEKDELLNSLVQKVNELEKKIDNN